MAASTPFVRGAVLEGILGTVHDGDTIGVYFEARPSVKQAVRLACIDTPEMADKRKRWALQPGAPIAQKALQRLLRLPGARVIVSIGAIDKYRRIVGFARFVDDKVSANQRMVALGWAYPYYLTAALRDTYNNAHAKARAKAVGLFDGTFPPLVTPAEWRRGITMNQFESRSAPVRRDPREVEEVSLYEAMHVPEWA